MKQKRVNATKKKPARKKSVGFWSAQLDAYKSSWNEWWSLRTLWHASLDLLLFFTGLFLLSFNSVTANAINEQLGPLIAEINTLEASNSAVTPEMAANLLATYNVDVNSLLLQLILASAAFFLLFLIAYALVKTKIWTSLRGEKWSLRRYGLTLAVTMAWAIIATGLLYLALLLAPLTMTGTLFTTALFLLLTIATLAWLPLSYAFNPKEWKRLCTVYWKKLFGRHALALAVIIITWLVLAYVVGLTYHLHPILYVTLFIILFLGFTAWTRNYLHTILFTSKRWVR